MKKTLNYIKKRSLADAFSGIIPSDDICGKWQGSITFSVRKEAFPVFFSFEKDGSYQIKVRSKRSMGTYYLEHNRIVVAPISPKGIRPTTLFWTLQDQDTLRIKGRVLWVEGNLVAQRKK